MLNKVKAVWLSLRWVGALIALGFRYNSYVRHMRNTRRKLQLSGPLEFIASIETLGEGELRLQSEEARVVRLKEKAIAAWSACHAKR